MLILQGVAYTHPDKEVLFDNLDMVINTHDKIALVGNNGTGKSTLLKIMAGALSPSAGIIKTAEEPYYVPQVFGQFNDYTIAQALQVEGKIKALQEILAGNVAEENFIVLNDDWDIEERCKEALSIWHLDGIGLSQKMDTLSGGEKTKVFLAGIHVHKPQIVLLDEPSNHLDITSRDILYGYIRSTNSTLVIVSHDRALLNLLDKVCELSTQGIKLYGGNYDFYAAQKANEEFVLHQNLRSKEKELRKAKEIERESIERQQKLDARGKKKQLKAGVPTIALNTLRNNAEKSTSRMKDVHAEKVGGISQEVNQMRKELPGLDKMKMGFDDSELHKGKVLIDARDINISYDKRLLWDEPLNLLITSGERIAIKGSNGVGKTSLIKILLAEIEPTTGTVYRAVDRAIYIDQDYSLINNALTVYEQAEAYNYDKLEEHEVKSLLTHFLFTKEAWDKNCKDLSGGEKMRLMLCCITLGKKPPDIIVLDEPTNNLDIQNIEILTNAVNDYSGTLIVISHDSYFLEQVNMERTISLK